MQIKECKHCGKQFETYKFNKIYCSKDCQRKGWDKKNKEKIRARSKGCASTKGKDLLNWCNENGEYGQKLLAEYSSKNKLIPEKMSAGSHKTAYWVCSTCEYEWDTAVRYRTSHGCGCPSCAGHITETNNLYLWCMKNGERGQRILAEYSSKNELSPEEIAPISDKRLYWKCSTCGHEWVVGVGRRTSLGCDCPKCDKTSTSYGEQILYYILQRELKEHKVLNRAKVEGYEVDVFIPDLKFGIEYSGYNYHVDKVEQDKIKKEALKVAGYNVITILEKRSINGDLDCNFSFIRSDILNPDEMLHYLKSYMKENYGLSIEISLSVDEREVCKRNSAKQYIDIDEVVLLQVNGKKNKEIAETLNCTVQLLWHRKRIFTEEELAQKEDDISCIVLGTRFGDSAEKIASDFDLDIDFVKKIQLYIKKYSVL